ncbi:MAG: hypothetical protein AUJ04_09945 [Acidobacteria bacterium 13_1_40CM_3_55_6]|nr:MAG: hypothetical protein AUJ04_09945 [Acidobacteria bacterium 13_1_40CM_3_55_6]
MFFERVRDVLQEDQPKHDVLILSSVHVPTQFVGSGPKRRFKLRLRAESFLPLTAFLLFLNWREYWGHRLLL